MICGTLEQTHCISELNLVEVDESSEDEDMDANDLFEDGDPNKPQAKNDGNMNQKITVKIIK